MALKLLKYKQILILIPIVLLNLSTTQCSQRHCLSPGHNRLVKVGDKEFKLVDKNTDEEQQALEEAKQYKLKRSQKFALQDKHFALQTIKNSLGAKQIALINPDADNPDNFRLPQINELANVQSSGMGSITTKDENENEFTITQVRWFVPKSQKKHLVRTVFVGFDELELAAENDSIVSVFPNGVPIHVPWMCGHKQPSNTVYIPSWLVKACIKNSPLSRYVKMWTT